LCKYLDREQRETRKNDIEKRKRSKIIEKYRKNAKKIEDLKIFIDNGQKILPENVARPMGPRE
jgi:hypothetical protein